MKKLILILLILSTVFQAVSCGEYTPPVNPGGQGGNNPGGGDDPAPDVGIQDELTEESFTVALSYNGKRYIPTTEVEVRWSDGFSIHSKMLSADGTAYVNGLDGDYYVTLYGLPTNYTYDPNVQLATNDNRNITIEIYRITRTTGKGSDPYNAIPFTNTGVYVSTLESANHVIYYQFTPKESGVYSVESWVDATENNVNPQCDVYNGSFAYKQYSHTIDDGGLTSTYTKNFKHEVKITDDMVGNAFTWGVKITAKDGKYPQSIYFAIKLDGEFSLNSQEPEMIIPKEDFVRAPEYDKSKYNFVGCEINDRGSLIFDGSMFGFNEEDGYYHVFNPETGKYDGPVLYAYINQPCRFYDTAFTQIEYRGNKALTINNGTENYKMFLEGLPTLLVDPPSLDLGPYFCNLYCPCLTESTCIGGCPESCEKCIDDCRHLSDEIWALIEANGGGIPDTLLGYNAFTNSDGVYPVTKELKDFLYKFSVSQLLFMDGNGFVETNPALHIHSTEEDQWLFACGYYVEK